MKNGTKIIISVIVCVLVLIAAVGLGSVYVPPVTIIQILFHKVYRFIALPESISEITASIIWKLRLPRALLAFAVGGALAVSGAVMQSVLKNPLASSFTLGVSSGAALGAGIVMVSGVSIPFLGILTLPVVGLLSGLLTVFLAVGFAAKMDKGLGTHTIILTGIVFSMFTNALLSLISALFKGYMQRIIYWQMGSFAMRDWLQTGIVSAVTAVGILFLMRYSRELDIMTFGEEQAQSIGVDLKRVKWILLAATAVLTGCAVAFAGVIGFIDLTAPHVARKIFGSRHKFVVPMSALFGGSFMVIADLIARTIISPTELPVGTITALIGAPFFVYVFFRKGEAR